MATSAGRAQQPVGNTATRVLVALVAALVAVDAVLRSLATPSPGAASRRAAAGSAAAAAGAFGTPARTRGRTLALLTAALLVAAAVAAVIALTSSGTGAAGPDAAASQPAGPNFNGSTVTVQRRDLELTTTVPGRLGYADPQTVYDRLRGRVSSLPNVGQVIAAGQPLFTVKHTPVVLMYGSIAAHRTLAPSDRSGADLEQLNANLHALGYGGQRLLVDDAWQPATTIAVKQLQHRLGVAQTGRLELGTVVFLPTAQVVLARRAGVGAAAAVTTAKATVTTAKSTVTTAKPKVTANTATATAPAKSKSPGAGGAKLTAALGASADAAPTAADARASGAANSKTSQSRQPRVLGRRAHDTSTTVTFADPGTPTTATPSTTSTPSTPAPTGAVQTVTATIPTTEAPTNTAPATTAPSSTDTATKKLQQTVAEKRKQQQQAALQAQQQAALQAQQQATLKAQQQAAAERAQQQATQAVTTRSTVQTTPASSGSSAATGNQSAHRSRPVVPLALLSTAPAKLLVTVELGPQQRSLATVGRPAQVRLPDGSRQPGKVLTVGSSTSQGTPAIIELTQPLTDLKLNHSTVTVSFILREARGVLAVPRSAVLTTSSHGSTVAQVGSSPTLLRVNTGLAADGFIQISGRGIHQGLTLAASGRLAPLKRASQPRSRQQTERSWL